VAAKRRVNVHKPPAKESSNPPEKPPFQQVVDSQMDLWKKWNQKAGTDLGQIATEVSPIVSQYWSKMLEDLWQSAETMQTSEDPIVVQENLRKRMMSTYNEMMKKVFMTKSFSARSGGQVTGLLDNVRTWNEVMEETLKAMRLPTRGDIDDIHESLYNLSKRIDSLAKSLEDGGTRRRQSR